MPDNQVRDAIDRRRFLAVATLLAAGSCLPAMAGEDQAAREHMHMMNSLPPDAPTVAMLVYPDMVALDLIGPMTVFRIARFDTSASHEWARSVTASCLLPIMAVGHNTAATLDAWPTRNGPVLCWLR